MTPDIINQLYNELLMRDADPTALQSFGGMQSDAITNTLMNSPEYLIQQQAQKELGRALAPDVGMAYYLSEAQSGVPLDTLLANITNSPEAQAIDNQFEMDDAVFVGNQSMPIEAEQALNFPSEMQLRQITPGSNFLPTNIPTGFFGADDNVAQLYNLGQTPTFRSGVGGYTDMLPSGFEFGVPAQFAQVPIFMRGLFNPESEEDSNNLGGTRSFNANYGDTDNLYLLGSDATVDG